MSTTFFVLAGEASGDLHGAKLLEALKSLEPSARFIGMGGPKMAAAGLEVAKDLDGMQVVGFWEVAKKYGFFRKVFYQLLDRVKQERPAALLCIDYPGFNLRFAAEVRKLGIPCLYYIVPQVWAWKPKRAARMAEYIDRAYCVFDFEPPFFERYRTAERKMQTVFVGHPLLDQPKPPRLELPPGPKTVSYLPGSRPGEFSSHYKPMCHSLHAAQERAKPLRALMSVPVPVPFRKYERAWMYLMGDWRGAFFTYPLGNYARETYPMRAKQRRIITGPENEAAILDKVIDSLFCNGMSHASMLPALSDFSVVKSGTSTLEAGLQGNPMCVVYKSSWINYAIARALVDIPVFSLVNIVLGRYAVPELLQGEVNPARIAAEIERGLTDQRYIEAQRAALSELPAKLGGPGASLRAARGMLDFLKGKE